MVNDGQEEEKEQNNEENLLSMDQIQSEHNSSSNSLLRERKELQEMLVEGIGAENQFERSRPIT